MSQDLTTFANSQVPDHIRAAFGGVVANSDLSQGVQASYPVVSYKGKVWAVTENGERSVIMNDDDEPVGSIRAVIIRANPNLNKIYYPDGYEEGSTDKPTCYSNDAITPALDVQDRQATKCGICPHNQWGSKITENGAKGKACADARRLAIAPEGELDRAMLLRVPAASLRELLAYGEQLTKRGVPYQVLVTKLGFDHTVAYPKLSFKPERWLDAEEVAKVQEMYESDTVRSVVALDAPSAPAEEAVEAADDFLPPGGPPAAQAAPAAAPAPTRRKKAQAAPAEVAEALAPVAEAAPAKPKTTGFGGSSKPQAAPVQAQPTAAVPDSAVQELAAGAMAELDAVLGEFDDEEDE